MKKKYEKHQALAHYDEYLQQKKVVQQLRKFLDLEKNNKSILSDTNFDLEIKKVGLDALFPIEQAFKKCFPEILKTAILIQQEEMETTLLVCEEELDYTYELIKKEKNTGDQS